MDDDSPETRQQGFRRLKRILEMFGSEKLTLSEKIKRFKGLTPDQFLSLVSKLNGVLLGLPSPRQYHNEDMTGVIDTPPTIYQRGEKYKISYFAPANRVELFKKLFLQIQSEINENNYAVCIRKIYLGIVFAHLFRNANGRTSRVFEKVFLGESVLESDLQSDMFTSEEGVPEMVHKIALIKLFQEEEEQWDANFLKVQTVEDVLEYSKLMYKNPVNMDLSRAVKGLAIRRVFKDRSLPELMENKPLEWVQKDVDGSWKRYNDELFRLQEKLFWTAISLAEDLQK